MFKVHAHFLNWVPCLRICSLQRNRVSLDWTAWNANSLDKETRNSTGKALHPESLTSSTVIIFSHQFWPDNAFISLHVAKGTGKIRNPEAVNVWSNRWSVTQNCKDVCESGHYVSAITPKCGCKCWEPIWRGGHRWRLSRQIWEAYRQVWDWSMSMMKEGNRAKE